LYYHAPIGFAFAVYAFDRLERFNSHTPIPPHAL
jgi:hypothetical protein